MIVKERCGTKIKNPNDVYQLIKTLLSQEAEIDRDKEHFYAIGLNSKNQIKYVDLVSLGSLDTTVVHPREVFRLAIYKAVDSLIVAHNHPSGYPDPTEEDNKITEKLKKSGEIIGIDILDHVIIGENEYYTYTGGKVKEAENE